jgi:hypothetical protein
MEGIRNSVARIWDTKTLNNVLAQLSHLNGAVIKRDDSAGTVVVTYKDRVEVLKSLRAPSGWLTRYDSKLFEQRPVAKTPPVARQKPARPRLSR